eukprot:12406968-Karenia_brevis.AAC.1
MDGWMDVRHRQTPVHKRTDSVGPWPRRCSVIDVNVNVNGNVHREKQALPESLWRPSLLIQMFLSS